MIKNKLHKSLPYITLIALVILIASAVYGSFQRQNMLVDDGQTRQRVESSMQSILSLTPEIASDTTLLNTVRNLQKEPYVVYVWLFAPDGQIIYSSNKTFSTGSALDRATSETQRLLNTIPPDLLSGSQKTALLAASALQAEGEHNDVFRHLLRPVFNPQGDICAWVGLAFEVSAGIAQPGTLWIANLLIGLLSAGIYWFALPLWAFIDARLRGERAWAWAAFILLGNLAALLAYLLVRSPRSD